jgi:hypothetical protein
MQGLGGGGEAIRPAHRLAVACLFRDARPFLREWIEHHLAMGVERFYLCDHLSADGGADLVAPYVAAGVATLVRCEREFVDSFEAEIHLPFFDAVLKAAAGHCEWVACLDADEFLAPVRPDDEDAIAVLDRHADAAALYVNWVAYGTSGVRRVPTDRLMTETLVRRAPETSRPSQFVKAIVRPERYVGTNNPHTFRLLGGALGRLTDGTFIVHDTLPDHAALDEIRINHYTTGDADYFERIKAPFYARYAPKGPLRDEVLSRAARMAYCEVLDRSADRFAPVLRERVLGARTCVVVDVGRDGSAWRRCRPYLYDLSGAGVLYDLVLVGPDALPDGAEAFFLGCRDRCGSMSPAPVALGIDHASLEEAGSEGEGDRAIAACRAAADRIAFWSSRDRGRRLSAAHSRVLYIDARHREGPHAVLGDGPRRIGARLEAWEADEATGVFVWRIADPTTGTGRTAAAWMRRAVFDALCRREAASSTASALEGRSDSASPASFAAAAGTCGLAVRVTSDDALDVHPLRAAQGDSDKNGDDDDEGGEEEDAAMMDGIEKAHADRIGDWHRIAAGNVRVRLWDPAAHAALEAAFDREAHTEGDIWQHVASMYALARGAAHVTELASGCNGGSWALARALAHGLMVPRAKGRRLRANHDGDRGAGGDPTERRYVAVDMEACSRRLEFARACAGVGLSVETRVGDTARTEIERTDVLFVDSWHVYAHMKRELERHHDKVGSLIILHDTTVDAEWGETLRMRRDATAEASRFGYPIAEVRRGVWPAVREFLEAHGDEWTLAHRWTHCNGLAVLSRRPRCRDLAPVA